MLVSDEHIQPATHPPLLSQTLLILLLCLMFVGGAVWTFSFFVAMALHMPADSLQAVLKKLSFLAGFSCPFLPFFTVFGLFISLAISKLRTWYRFQRNSVSVPGTVVVCKPDEMGDGYVLLFRFPIMYPDTPNIELTLKTWRPGQAPAFLLPGAAMTVRYAPENPTFVDIYVAKRNL